MNNKVEDYYGFIRENCPNVQILDDLDIGEYVQKMEEKKNQMQEIVNQSVMHFESIN